MTRVAGQTPRAGRVPVYILAGGRSSRFGSDKARAVLDGEPLIVRIARALAPVAASTQAVAREPGAYEDLGLRTIADAEPGLGPVAGLAAACRDAAAAEPERAWLLLVSCDLLEVRPAWVELLLAGGDAVADAVAFKHRVWEPLLAIYRPRLAGLCEQRLARGERSMQGLLDVCASRSLPLPRGWPVRVQANTQRDLEEHRIARGRREARAANERPPPAA